MVYYYFWLDQKIYLKDKIGISHFQMVKKIGFVQNSHNS